MIIMTETKPATNYTASPKPNDDRCPRECSRGHHLGYTRKEKGVTTLYLEWHGLTVRIDGGATLWCPVCRADGVNTKWRWHVALDYIESLEKRRQKPGQP